MIIDKEFLKKHVEHRKELRNELQRYELSFGVSYYGKSPSNIDGMPHAHNSGDATYENVMRECDARNCIDKLEKLINQEYSQIEKILEKVVDADQKHVIRLKYYNGMDWDDIADQMYGDVRNYCNNVEKYKTKVKRRRYYDQQRNYDSS